MSLDLRKWSLDLTKSWNKFLKDNITDSWIIYGFEGNTFTLQHLGDGDDGIDGLIDELSEGRLYYAGLTVKDPNSRLNKVVFIFWEGQSCPQHYKAKTSTFKSQIRLFFKGYHLDIVTGRFEDLDIKLIKDQVRKSSGANYSYYANRKDNSYSSITEEESSSRVKMEDTNIHTRREDPSSHFKKDDKSSHHKKDEPSSRFKKEDKAFPAKKEFSQSSTNKEKITARPDKPIQTKTYYINAEQKQYRAGEKDVTPSRRVPHGPGGIKAQHRDSPPISDQIQELTGSQYKKIDPRAEIEALKKSSDPTTVSHSRQNDIQVAKSLFTNNQAVPRPIQTSYNSRKPDSPTTSSEIVSSLNSKNNTKVEINKVKEKFNNLSKDTKEPTSSQNARSTPVADDSITTGSVSKRREIFSKNPVVSNYVSHSSASNTPKSQRANITSRYQEPKKDVSQNHNITQDSSKGIQNEIDINKREPCSTKSERRKIIHSNYDTMKSDSKGDNTSVSTEITSSVRNNRFFNLDDNINEKPIQTKQPPVHSKSIEAKTEIQNAMVSSEKSVKQLSQFLQQSLSIFPGEPKVQSATPNQPKSMLTSRSISHDSETRSNKQKPQVVAIYDYDAEEDDELSFKEGDIFTLINDEGDWWTAIDSTGRKGQIPNNYVEKKIEENITCIQPDILESMEPASQSNYLKNEPQRIVATPMMASRNTFGLPKQQSSDRYNVSSDLMSIASQPVCITSFKTEPVMHKKEPEYNASPAIQSEPPSSTFVVKALYDYTGEDETELTFYENDTLTVLNNEGEWWLARNAQGKTGNIPYNFVEICTEPSSVKMNEQLPKKKADSELEKRTVMYDYDKDDGDELDIKSGEIIFIIERNDNGWWLARNKNGQEGLIPSNYLE